MSAPDANNLLAPFQAEQPDILYHYASAEAFLGILRTSQLWATDYRYQNDPLEYEYAFSLAREIARSRAAATANSEVRDVLNAIAASRRGYPAGRLLYTLSFSTQPDVLSQWRAYADDGAGFAIGFPSRELALDVLHDAGKTVHEQDEVLVLRVEYDRGRQMRILGDLLDRSVEAVARGDRTVTPTTVLSQIGRVAVCMKQPAFEEESEWRIALLRNSNTASVRATARGLAPYCEFPLRVPDGGAFLRRLVLGPRQDPELAWGAIMRLFDGLGWHPSPTKRMLALLGEPEDRWRAWYSGARNAVEVDVSSASYR
jgi:hypothetical protein